LRKAIFLFDTKLCSHEKQNSFREKHGHSTPTHPLPLPPKHAHKARFVWFCRQSSASCCDKMAVGTSTSLPTQQIACVRQKRDEGNRYTAHYPLLSHAKPARTHALFKLTVQPKTHKTNVHAPAQLTFNYIGDGQRCRPRVRLRALTAAGGGRSDTQILLRSMSNQTKNDGKINARDACWS
jgi:hypothetical protein